MLLALLAAAVPAWSQSTRVADNLWRGFLEPPAETRPIMRWWWFGPAVEQSEIDREIRAMKSGGIGGFEVQPVYPLSPDAEPNGPRNLPYLSDPFIAALRHAAQTARAEGMRIDVTGGSGWPYGGPHVPVTQAAAEIRMVRIAVPGDAIELMLPAAGPGEKLLAASIGPSNGRPPRVTLPIDRPRVTLSTTSEAREALVFVAGRTGQQVKRAAVGAEGYVIDHLNPAAVRGHLAAVGDRLLQAFAGEAPPDAIFSDSLEAYGSSWTDDLPAEFLSHRGYNLLDHLPALFFDTPDSSAVRFDWARTVSELVDERYLKVIDGWAREHGTKFRAQVYGFPPPTLSSNRYVALPEGEGADWRSFSATRWATSAAHIYGKPVVSSEVWTWLHSPVWAATPLDMKVEADRHFLQGVNQLVGHGWPYSPPGAAEPGWAFYAAAALSDHNPWYAVMPDVMRYLQRVSYLLRQGEPANPVAVYLPIEDAFAAMRPDKASLNEAMRERVPTPLVEAVLDSGNGFDFIDAGAIRARGLNCSILVLPPMERIDADAYSAIARWVDAGGKVLAVGGLPRSTGGWLEKQMAVEQLSRRLKSAKGVVIVDQARLSRVLAAAMPADVRLAEHNSTIGFVHRHLVSGDVYFLVNTANVPVAARAQFAADRGNGDWWDPMTGRQWSAGSGDISLELAPYESRVLVFAGAPKHADAPVRATSLPLADGWTMDIAGRPGVKIDGFRSWTDDASLRYFSGTATYRRTVAISLPTRKCVALDFGSPSPRPIVPDLARPVAALDAPIRDAAVVYVNGVRVGSVWSPPYRIDISRALRSGPNRIEIRVSNTAMNLLAGLPRSDYRLLNLRYGERFPPQDFDRIAPQPSGLLATVSLIEVAEDAGSCPTTPSKD